MAMTMDHQQRLGSLPFHPLPAYSSAAPQFTNPWTTSTIISQGADVLAHHPSHPQHAGLPPSARASSSRPPNHHGMGTYALVPPLTSTALPAGVADNQAVLNDLHDLLGPRGSVSSSSYADMSYASATSSMAPGYPATSASFDPMGYAQMPMRSTCALPSQDRRTSQPQTLSSFDSDPAGHLSNANGLAASGGRFNDKGLSHDAARAFAEHVQESKHMMALHDDPTPRNIYGLEGRAGRGSADSYGFPSTHSSNSSISSASGMYGSHSVASSVSEYSVAGSDVESAASQGHALSGLGNLVGGVPPAPQTMMGQFSSKISCSSTKKHKCKVCDKRFTRPSSLQTHMYSHTGEKPFVCEVDGCGRHFSVVSNLRRHRKVHKSDARSETSYSDRLSVDDDDDE